MHWRFCFRIESFQQIILMHRELLFNPNLQIHLTMAYSTLASFNSRDYASLPGMCCNMGPEDMEEINILKAWSETLPEACQTRLVWIILKIKPIARQQLCFQCGCFYRINDSFPMHLSVAVNTPTVILLQQMRTQTIYLTKDHLSLLPAKTYHVVPAYGEYVTKAAIINMPGGSC